MLNELSQKEKAEGWNLLFDGKTTQGFHSYNNKTDMSAWKVADGTLYLDTTNKSGWQIVGGGDIITNEEFENFHLKLEWKVANAGNSGIMFLVNETPDFEFAWHTGPEMQILDNDNHPDSKIIKHRAGDLYDLISSSPITVRPAMQWNQAEIVINKGTLLFSLNEKQVLSTTLWDENWKTLIAASKFKEWASFGTFKKERFFNNAGAQILSDNYTIDPLRRIHLKEIEELIDQKRYFVLHAPRQTGKTTCMYALMRHFNAGTKYRALYVNIEAAQAMREDVEGVMHSIVSVFCDVAELHLGDNSGGSLIQEIIKEDKWKDALRLTIAHYSKNDHAQPNNLRPLILMIDEIDALIGDSLISVLRQIRAGYNDKPHAFPQSIILCGVRDVRDYRIHSSRTKEIITGGSAFNIKADSIRLGNFSKEEVNELYQQHTDETGQVFTEEARDLAWEYTKGQPWLVNALAYEITFRMKDMRDRTKPITGEIMRQAKERMVVSRATHIDQLVDKLQEPRVLNIIKPLLSGNENTMDFNPDDLLYCIDLGLITKNPETKQTEISNAIYQEVIPRELTWVLQMNLETTGEPQVWYLKNVDGVNLLDVDKLLTAFQQFYREHSEHWLKGMLYREAGPQLLLQAYLQRVVNGGGWIEREYGLGKGRTDLFVIWPVGPEPKQRIVIEVKVKREKDSLQATVKKGLKQTQAYMDRCKATHGHLVVFDPNPKKRWGQKIYKKKLTKTITLWGS
ncbi:hypothetical protein CHS0354_000419 [Potamilus streckersoni]|uniref:3-keto-alpha-glucoside-1,2-lyase/3-keto-2-hydroxy-glucal hydratase domain-containing protein n=1 Tax=Potamilus streckersoni TaxID=2493646 RepID=A0AAE0T6Q3_9BIVA|nr:hypothetical protein CHS0354_000419 [Potamilus streckersoni]